MAFIFFSAQFLGSQDSVSQYLTTLQILFINTLVRNWIQVAFSSADQFLYNVTVVVKCYTRCQMLSLLPDKGNLTTDWPVFLFLPIYQFSLSIPIYKPYSFRFDSLFSSFYSYNIVCYFINTSMACLINSSYHAVGWLTLNEQSRSRKNLYENSYPLLKHLILNIFIVKLERILRPFMLLLLLSLEI